MNGVDSVPKLNISLQSLYQIQSLNIQANAALLCFAAAIVCSSRLLPLVVLVVT